jgi:4a-hydroxytetrahydrobiopterin dehydratase
MTRPTKLDQGIEGWIKEHPGWTRGDSGGVVRVFDRGSFSRALAFVVQVGTLSERHDHPPELDIRGGTVRVCWTTTEVGGLTRLDLVLAEATDEIVG